jgi:tetratricopeptide (TPR) repeat protein
MSTTAATNRFIGSSITACEGFYQQLLTSALSIPELGKSLIRQAERARSFRQTDYVREIGLLLANLPLKKFRTAGHYYLGWAMYRGGQSERSKVMFERVAGSDAGAYQARALLSLGALEALKHDSASEARYYIEALKAPHDLYTTVEATRGIAVIKAKEGYHKNAVEDFEKFLPLAARCDVATYNLYLSSLAVELGESGRRNEARSISRVVLASPFAFAYPEWQETATELREPDRSFIALNPPRNNRRNVLRMPLAQHDVSGRIGYNTPARVVNLQQWKAKMGKEEKSPETPTLLQIINQIILFYTNKNTTDEQRYKMWEAVAKIMSQPDPSKTEPDDSEGA